MNNFTIKTAAKFKSLFNVIKNLSGNKHITDFSQRVAKSKQGQLALHGMGSGKTWAGLGSIAETLEPLKGKQYGAFVMPKSVIGKTTRNIIDKGAGDALDNIDLIGLEDAAQALKNRNYKAIAFDEAHLLLDPKYRKSLSPYLNNPNIKKVFLTASPIQKSKRDLNTMLSWLGHKGSKTDTKTLSDLIHRYEMSGDDLKKVPVAHYKRPIVNTNKTKAALDDILKRSKGKNTYRGAVYYDGTRDVSKFINGLNQNGFDVTNIANKNQKQMSALVNNYNDINSGGKRIIMFGPNEAEGLSLKNTNLLQRLDIGNDPNKYFQAGGRPLRMHAFKDSGIQGDTDIIDIITPEERDIRKKIKRKLNRRQKIYNSVPMWDHKLLQNNQ